MLWLMIILEAAQFFNSSDHSPIYKTNSMSDHKLSSSHITLFYSRVYCLATSQYNSFVQILMKYVLVKGVWIGALNL